MSERPGQPGGKRATNRARKTAELAQAALALFLEEGIQASTIDRITSAAGTAKGNFYRYFDDKAALVEHLIRPVFEQVSAGLDRCSDSLEAAPTPEVMLAAYQRLAFDLSGVLLGNRDVVLLYLQENRGPAAGAREPIAEVRSLIGRRVVEITDLAHSHHLLADIDPRVSALAVVGAVERLLMAVLTDEDIGDPIQAGEALIRMVLDGLRRR